MGSDGPRRASDRSIPSLESWLSVIGRDPEPVRSSRHSSRVPLPFWSRLGRVCTLTVLWPSSMTTRENHAAEAERQGDPMVVPL